jgi:hypothetical protein
MKNTVKKVRFVRTLTSLFTSLLASILGGRRRELLHIMAFNYRFLVWVWLIWRLPVTGL